jgi:short-subunit dehydrogenase
MTALVTGASTGIGAALLPLLAAEGHELVLVARRTELLEKHKSSLQERYRVPCHVVGLDLARPEAPALLHERTRALGLDVDVLVNNAGFGVYGPFSDVPWERQREMIAVNVLALTELTRLYVEEMKERRRGRILQVASTAAFQPGPRMAVYYATKAYVLSFSEALAYELHGTGVTVTTLCPGPTRSEFQEVAGYAATGLVEKAMMTSEEVARIGYRALLRGERLVVSGMKNRFLSVVAQVSPRGVVLPVTERLMRTRGNA